MSKDNRNIRNTANCSLKLIQKAAAEKWVKQLAFWHICKSNFGNSTIYNYRHRMSEIAERLNVSDKTLYNYISILRQKELVCDFRNHLVLLSGRAIKSQLKDKRKTQISIKNDDILWHVECRLYAKLLEAHIKKMAYNEALRRFGVRNSHKTEQSATLFQPSFSIRNTAKLLNINERTAIKVINTLVSLEIIEVKKSIARKITSDKLPVEMFADYPGYLYVTEKGTFQMFGNSIKLIEYPTRLPKITSKNYVKNYKSIKCKKYNNL